MRLHVTQFSHAMAGAHLPCTMSHCIASCCSSQEDLYLIYHAGLRRLLLRWCSQSGLPNKELKTLEPLISTQALFLKPIIDIVKASAGTRAIPSRCPDHLRRLIKACCSKSPSYGLICGPLHVEHTLHGLSKGEHLT